MKRILLMGFTATIITFANVSHADFTFNSNSQNGCEYISGHWAGSGKASNWVIGDCVYHGSGMTSAVDNIGTFTMEVSADKVSGSILCPNHTTKQLTGRCNNGAVTIATEYGNLNGNFSKNSGDAKGTLSVAPGMSADVIVQFQRIG